MYIQKHFPYYISVQNVCVLNACMITFYVFYLKSIFYDVQITVVKAIRSNRGPFVNICKIDSTSFCISAFKM